MKNVFRKPKFLVLLTVFVSSISFGQNGNFYRFEHTTESYCSNRVLKYKIDNVWDFFAGYTPNEGNSHPKYFKITLTGPIHALFFYDEYQLVNELIDNPNEVILQFASENTSNWFGPEWATIKIDGYYSDDGGNTFTEIPMDYIDNIPIKNDFPDIYGPDELNDPSPVQFSINPNEHLITSNAPVSLNWSTPNGWSILSDVGSEITVQPTAQAGSIVLTTSPQVDACNYYASKPVTIGPCFTRGISEFEFCYSSPEHNIIPRREKNDKNLYPILTGDFNNDGELDIVSFQDNTKVALSGQNPSVWSSGFVNTGGQWETPRMVGDFSGDGKDDIIIFGFNVTQVGVSLNGSFSTAPFNDYYALTFNDGYNDFNKVQRLIGNFNGDQYDDIVAFGYNEHDVALSNGSSFNANLWNGTYKFSANNGWDDYDKNPKFVGDFNGDGMDDIIGFGNDQVIVGISTGSEFVFSDWATMLTYNNGGHRQSTHHRAIADFNGDGMDDIIGFGGNSVVVGISTGTGFIMDTWLMEYFTPGYGWDVEGRELGSVWIDINDYAKNDRVCFGDVNGDGFDDIVGFKNAEVWVSYSDGSKFLCPALSDGQFTNVEGRHTTRLVGNFDNSDAAEEIIALEPGYDTPYSIFFGKSHYLNCNSCDMPVASAELIKSNGSIVENGVHSIEVYDYCENVTIDVSSSSCYNNYFFKVHEFDNQVTGDIITTVFNSNWILGDAPNEINLSSYYNFQPNTLYMVEFGVGFNVDSKYMFVRMNSLPPSISVNLTNENSSRLATTRNGLEFPINSYCADANYMVVNATQSMCYDEYRFELMEVNSNLVPVGSPLNQVPSGGAWGVGVVPTYAGVSTSGMVLGKFYRVQVFLKNANGIEVLTWYAELSDCTTPPPRNARMGAGAELKEEQSASIFPNPSSQQIINIKLPDYGEKISKGTIYSMTGAKLVSFDLESNTVNTINLGNMASGTYRVEIISDEKVETILFVISEE